MAARRRFNSRHPIPHILCDDGFSMSVQVGERVKCVPRNDLGPWSAVEVGFPSMIEPLLWNYAETPGDCLSTVYRCVPIGLVAAIVECHGGFSKYCNLDRYEGFVSS